MRSAPGVDAPGARGAESLGVRATIRARQGHPTTAPHVAQQVDCALCERDECQRDQPDRDRPRVKRRYSLEEVTNHIEHAFLRRSQRGAPKLVSEMERALGLAFTTSFDTIGDYRPDVRREPVCVDGCRNGARDDARSPVRR